jgi:transcriptional regulator with XRE-family HTH domain
MGLSEWLDKKGISEREFGDRIGLTQAYVNRLRRGLATPSVITAVTIRNETNGDVTVDDLVPISRRVQAANE